MDECLEVENEDDNEQSGYEIAYPHLFQSKDVHADPHHEDAALPDASGQASVVAI